MTAQISDSVLHEDDWFSLTALSGDGMFHPKQIGLEVKSRSTANWRGFYCSYSISNSMLCLTELSVGFNAEDLNAATNGAGPIHFGKLPSQKLEKGWNATTCETEYFDGDWRYTDIQHQVSFTGGMLIGREYSSDWGFGIGNALPYEYDQLYELSFDRGKLTSAVDCSSQRLPLEHGPLETSCRFP